MFDSGLTPSVALSSVNLTELIVQGGLCRKKGIIRYFEKRKILENGKILRVNANKKAGRAGPAFKKCSYCLFHHHNSFRQHAHFLLGFGNGINFFF